MAEKKKNNTAKETIKERLIREAIQEIKAPEVLRTHFMPYAMSVIVSRAIPQIDGLKPSHRKLLYTMYEMGLLGGTRTKSANVAARTMLLNPHGDAANYETAVRMTQNNEAILTPLIDGKGNFGKHYSRDMAFAASRYTEMKLMPIAAEFFKSIKKGTVDMVDNYDSTRKEPVLLPVTFPNILANPTEGIAVGLASSIPSFNLAELCDATVLRIQHPETPVSEVMPAPDFTTGGYLLLDEDTRNRIYDTGRGTFKLRAKYNVDAKHRVIEVTEIPYSTTAEAVIEGIIDLVRRGKANEVSDVRNETGLRGFKIAIDYKRGVDPDALMQKLYRTTKLQTTYSCNMTIILDEKPYVLGVTDILDEWIKWRKKCVIKELKYDREKTARDLHMMEGLAAVLLDIDKAVSTIRNAKHDRDVIPGLMRAFGIDEEQAAYVSEIKLRNLNRDYILDKTKSVEILRKEIADLDRKIKSPKEICKLITAELKAIKKKYGRPRRTEIIPDDEQGALPIIQDYPVRVFLTKEKYLKKVPSSSLKGQYEIRVKDGDSIVKEWETTNSGELLVFTDRHNVYKIQTSDIRDSRPSEIGCPASNFCEMEDGEDIIFVTTSDAGKELLIAFDNGKAARIPLSSYETKQNRKKLVNAYSALAGVMGFYVLNGPEDFAWKSTNGKTLVISSDTIPLKTTRTTQGVQVLRLNKGASCKTCFRLAEKTIKKADQYRSAKIPSPGK